ncbi:TetR/AcrR family transcriptional regulator [Metapseudomonas boanensis]|uniref:TetR/AcrR family transcriptional regulator n=1 Tax=Metapseudomonas boanensis TaxID=2822138 RepID=A0ABS5XCE9_9GAMM|nr:TetR/AcrR family transcriptional regulator [Pseudomonas boanensis]MBT8765363.1 TetR/AcrR family transcriptional regulator [Pseudomonas boanensis]
MAYRASATRIDRDLELRGRILARAHARVVEGGFAALTMQALAEDVGIATGSLYRHFAGKGELAAEVFAQASQVEVDSLADVLRGPGPVASRLAAGLRQFAARAWHSRQLAFALIAEPVDPQVDEQRLRYREAYAELFCRLLEEGQARGEFEVPSVPLAAACLVGAIAESLVGPLSPAARAERVSGLAPDGLQAVSDSLVTFCLRALGASQPVQEDQP